MSVYASPYTYVTAREQASEWLHTTRAVHTETSSSLHTLGYQQEDNAFEVACDTESFLQPMHVLRRVQQQEPPPPKG